MRYRSDRGKKRICNAFGQNVYGIASFISGIIAAGSRNLISDVNNVFYSVKRNYLIPGRII